MVPFGNNKQANVKLQPKWSMSKLVKFFAIDSRDHYKAQSLARWIIASGVFLFNILYWLPILLGIM